MTSIFKVLFTFYFIIYGLCSDIRSSKRVTSSTCQGDQGILYLATCVPYFMVLPQRPMKQLGFYYVTGPFLIA